MKVMNGKLFIISTLLFVVVVTVFIWFFYPPALATRQENIEENQRLTDLISQRTATKQLIDQIGADKTKLTDLYDLAVQAYPASERSDLLLLQLDGLTKAAGVTATITVPFSGAVTVTPTAPPADETEIKAGQGTSTATTPIVTGSDSNFSVSGTFSYEQTQNLISRLATFIRWNQLTAISISSGDAGLTVTLAGKSFWSNHSVKSTTISGPALIESATKLFGEFQSYSTEPDITTEGSFGVKNPFGK